MPSNSYNYNVMQFFMNTNRNHTTSLMILVLMATMLVSACSSQEVNRTLYSTLGNIGDQQCSKETLANCQQQQGYATYRKEREQVLDGQN